MRYPMIIPALLLGGAGLAGCQAPQAPAAPDAGVAQSRMPEECRAQAASRFGQTEDVMSTGSVERRDDAFTVRGQYPPDSANATYFTCTFTPNGEFVSVDLG
jgi:hypothetical protein